MIRMLGAANQSQSQLASDSDDRSKAIKRAFRDFVAANPGCTFDDFADVQELEKITPTGRKTGKPVKRKTLRNYCRDVAGVVGVNQSKQGGAALRFYLEGTEP